MIIPALLLALTAQGIPAFPEAEGWGAMALDDCRSLPLEVLFVTDLSNSGAGSLRGALTAARSDRYTIIIFRTGGTISLTSGSISWTGACVYLAGQSAPGGGILVRPATTGGILNPRGGQFLIRYMRLRHTGLGTPGAGGGALGFTHHSGATASNSIVDHVSVSWTNDEGINFHRGVFTCTGDEPDCEGTEPPMENVTVQRTIAAEANASHSTGISLGGQTSCTGCPFKLAGFRKIWQFTIHHNLMASNGQRNPSSASSSAQNTPTVGTEVINNVTYNWNRNAYEGQNNSVTDVINNYWKQGPNTPTNPGPDRFVARYERHPKDQPANEFARASIYIKGNVSDSTPGSTQWNMIRNMFVTFEVMPDSLKRGWASNWPTDSAANYVSLPQPPFPVTLQTASTALTSVLADVGANARVDCVGDFIPASDAVDLRVIAYTLNNTGPSSIPDTIPAPGFPTIDPGTPCTDSDLDGMPDDFELLCSGSTTGLANDGDMTGDGFWNLEEWLNGSNVSGRTLDWNDNSNNEDGFHVERDQGAGFIRIDTVGPDVTTYFDIGARIGDNYRVISFNAGGESVPSVPATAACR